MGATSTEPTDTERLLADADSELERERRRVTDEIDALKRFGRTVETIESTEPAARGFGAEAFVTTATGSTGRRSLARVREAYESTVMAVPHYDEEYDDTYAESLGAEFDPHVAVALTEGSAFDRRCKETLLSAVTEARTARRSLLAAIDDETESLSAATDRLTDVAAGLDRLAERPVRNESFGALDAYRARIGQLEEHCEAVLADRQETVFDQRRAAWLPADAPDIAQYLYQDLESAYPVMAAVADLLERLANVRARVERAMTFCHA